MFAGTFKQEWVELRQLKAEVSHCQVPEGRATEAKR